MDQAAPRRKVTCAQEWGRGRKLLGDAALAALQHIDQADVEKHGTGPAMPSLESDRLMTLIRIVDCFVGPYDRDDIARWVGRQRLALGGASPGDLLAAAWVPDGSEIARVAGIAEAVLPGGATSGTNPRSGSVK